MPVPYLGNALNGWTKERTIKIISRTAVAGGKRTYSVASTGEYRINIQPSPARVVDRKPQGERNWAWWSIILQNDSVFFPNGTRFVDEYGKQYKIQSGTDWRESGFTKYEAIEDYVGEV
jgi:hypothetical protein